MSTETTLLVLVLLAGFYMAWNIGANDVANAMGTSVGSGALSLRQAVFVAAILEFSGAFFFGSHVSDTIQNGIIDSSIFASKPLVLVYGMLASLLAAGAWLQVASYFGWPVSTTHSIVGAIVGFGWIVGGWEAVYWENVFSIVGSWIISPLLGGVISYLIFSALRKRIFYNANPIEATKKLTPILVFIVIGTLSLIMMFKGLQNLDLNLSLAQAIVFSLSAALIGSIISIFCIRKITPPERLKTQTNYGPEVALSLEKAKKHLQRVKAACAGEAKYETSLILEGMDQLSESLKKTVDVDAVKSEYDLVERIFSYLQVISACLMAFAHGANDVANAIGPLSASIAVLTTHTVVTQASVPIWALALGGIGIVVGLATWGWRVIETIGKKITELTPTRGFAAEFGAAVTVVIASRFGFPISTTHTLVGSVVGVGLARGIEALDLTMTRDIVISWIVTVPAGALIAVGFFYGIQSIFG
jgi:PiT family inorganic phosphate transporter